MLRIWELIIENKHTLSHGKDCKKKFCETLRENSKNIIDSEKTNVTVNKITKITSTCKSMLYLWKKNLEIIEKLEIIAITQVNIEAQHIVFVI